VPWFASRLRRSAVKHEENLSAEQSAPKANARVSRPYGDPWRTERAEATPGEGPQATDGVDPTEATGVIGSGPARFPKHARLRKRSDFLRVQRNGRRHHTDHFVVLSVLNTGPTSRIGITVSTRVGNAVVRNRVKRMVREILRTSWRVIDPPGDVVVIAKSIAAQATHARAATELHQALGIARA